MPPELRPYQVDAIKLGVERGNLLIAAVMGAGKTAIAINIVEELHRRGEIQGGAVFCGSSLKYQWKREIEFWAPGSPVLVIDGDKKKRAAQYLRAHRYRYVILNYECLVNDWDLVQDYLPIDFIVGDEITAIKSFTSKRSRRLKVMAKHTDFRFGLSGQPVENRPEELFSIMEYVDRTVLGNFQKFDRTFVNRDNWGKPRSYKNLGVLSERLSQAMFRRSRADIAEFLPKVQTKDTPVPLDPWSQKLYDSIAEELLDLIDMAMSLGMGGFDLAAHYGQGEGDAESNALRGLIMSRVTVMRLLCDHPGLVALSAADYDDPDTKSGSQFASELLEAGLLKGAPKSSNKLKALMAAVEEILAESPTNKIVIFAAFKGALRFIADELSVGYATITGDVSSRIRDASIVSFNTDPACRVFLSSDAGAYGVNLDAGTHLINYDLPWSGGAFAQRVARIDRTSTQHESIVIDSMFGDGTVEEWQFEMLAQKRKISEAFTDGVYDPKGQISLDLSSLRAFIDSHR